MKHLITAIVLTTGLAAGPVMADHEGGNLLNKENVGGAIGAAIGGFAGNKIVKGKGQSAATAAGAVGGFLLGKNVAHNYRGNTHQSRGYTGYRGQGPNHGSSGHRQTELSRMNETMVAKTATNVRAGPSTHYSITDRLHRRESVHVVGKVKHGNWYMVRAHGRQGFVYAPLLTPPHYGYRSHASHGGYQKPNYRRNESTRGWHR